MHERIARLRELLEQLRAHIRPEGHALAGSLSVAIDQTEAEAEAMGAVPEPSPVEVQLQGLRAELGQLLHLPVQVTMLDANITAMRESAGI